MVQTIDFHLQSESDPGQTTDFAKAMMDLQDNRHAQLALMFSKSTGILENCLALTDVYYTF